MFTTSFSIKRCLTLARYDLFTRRRTYLLWFLGIYAILTIVNMNSSIPTAISPPAPIPTPRFSRLCGWDWSWQRSPVPT